MVFQHRINPVGMYQHGKAVVQQLEALGIKSIIAGGFCRDSIFGITPKDIDIIVCERDMTSCVDLYCKGNPQAGKYYEQYEEGINNPKLAGVIKLAVGVDIIFHKVEEPLEALQYFDCSLNQLYIKDVLTMDIEYTGKYPIADIRLLTPVTFKRFCKLREKVNMIKLTSEYKTLSNGCIYSELIALSADYPYYTILKDILAISSTKTSEVELNDSLNEDIFPRGDFDNLYRS